MRELTLRFDEVETLQQGFGVLAEDGVGVRMQVLPLSVVVNAPHGPLDGFGTEDQLVLDHNQLVHLRGGSSAELRTRAGEPIRVGCPGEE